MSVAALTWAVEDVVCSTAQAKLVLIIYANFANEHGRVYPSTETVARLTGQNIKTVRNAIDTLERDLLLIDTGKRVGRTGNVKVYAIGMEGLPKVGALKGETAPDAPEGAAEVSREALPETGALGESPKAPVSGPKPSQKRVAEPVLEPDTPENADAFSAPRGAGKRRGSSIPEDWTPPAIDVLPDDVAAIARQWPAGAYASHAAAFHRFNRSRNGRAGRALDWTDAWCARISQLGAAPIRDGRAGLKFTASPPAAATASPAMSAEKTARLFERMGRHDDAAEIRRSVATSGGR